MPIQAPQWTDYLICPVCCREFGPPPRSPVSLSCGHTVCRHCLKNIHKKRCPFDQTLIMVEPDELVTNTALLQLAGYTPPAQPHHPPSIQALPESDQLAYDLVVRSMEQLAVYVKFCAVSTAGRLSRPMQRKLVSLLQCCPTDEEARGRAARAARSLAERSVTELILHHQNPQQVCANLWAAVRARGCQYLGPAMQEEVLKLVLLALEDGSLLSRKVLVMFVVQRLEPHFPQASKTSVGHVVQLLYRASCFKVSKRERDSSLMQLKEEFRSYDSLRREHDGQIVQIAIDAGLRIAPDQWSALLYGDTAHKGHMQSIIDKLQTPQSFAQSIQELVIALQRTRDPNTLAMMNMHLELLASIDVSPDAKSPSWAELAEIMASLKEVVSGLVYHLQQQAIMREANYNFKHLDRLPEPMPKLASPQAVSNPAHNKYKVAMCRDAAARSFCPRGAHCTFAHSEEELERYRVLEVGPTANFAYIPALPALQMYPRYPMPPPPHPHAPQLEYGQPLPPSLQLPSPNAPKNTMERVPNYPPPPLPPMLHRQQLIKIDPNGMMIPMPHDRAFYAPYGGGYLALPEDVPVPYPDEYLMQQSGHIPYPVLGQAFTTPPPPYPPSHYGRPAYSYEELPSPLPPGYHPTHLPPPPPRERLMSWPTNNDLYNFEAMQNSLLCSQPATDDYPSHAYVCDLLPNTNTQLSPQNLPLLAYAVGEAGNQAAFEANSDRRAVGADRTVRNDRVTNHAGSNHAVSSHAVSDLALSDLALSNHAFSSHALASHGGSSHGGSNHGGSNHGGSDHAFSNHALSNYGLSSLGGSNHAGSDHAVSNHAFLNHALSNNALSGLGGSNHSGSDLAFSNHALSNHSLSSLGGSNHAGSDHSFSNHALSNHGLSSLGGSNHAGPDHAVSNHAFLNHALSNHALTSHGRSSHAGSDHAALNLAFSNHPLSSHAVSDHAVTDLTVSDHAFSHHGVSSHRLTNHGLTNHGLTNHGQTNRGLTNHGPTNHGLTNHGLTNHGLTNHGLTNQGLTNHGLTNHGLTNYGLTNHGLTNHGLTNHGLTNHGLTNHGLSNRAVSSHAVSSHPVSNHTLSNQAALNQALSNQAALNQAASNQGATSHGASSQRSSSQRASSQRASSQRASSQRASSQGALSPGALSPGASNLAASNEDESNPDEKNQDAPNPDDSNNGSDEELEVELQELIRRIDTEF